MRRFLASLTVLTALTAALAVVALARPASQQVASSGCVQLNDPSQDADYGAAALAATFDVGDHITMTAGLPAFGSPTQVVLTVDGSQVASAAYPGTVEYVIGVAGTHTVVWNILPLGPTDGARWTVGCTSNPTAVTVASAGASRTGQGVLVGWRTGTEADLLGFQVYRSRGHSWQRISHSLIAAKGSVSGTSYRFLDKSARRGVSYRYRIKAVNRDGTPSWFGPVRVM